jgi:DUF1680 family protein
MKLRWPHWCRKASGVTLNGAAAEWRNEKGYITIEREWVSGDSVELKLAMPVERVYAHPKVRMNCGRVALRRGPIVYALEGVDNGTELNSLALPRNAELTARWHDDLLGGVVAITGKAVREPEDTWVSELYRNESPGEYEIAFKAIPYCCWDNRAPGEMLVWLREA